jgi:heme exporter protein C
MLKQFYFLASPKYFYDFSGKLLPWLSMLTLLLLGYGLIGGLYLAPPDYQQGNAFRIIYVHVPCAFLSLMIYTLMAFTAAIGWIWRIKLADVIVTQSASLGASFTLLALITGAIWGKPMWGTWWVWDARLTSELILFFLYIGYIALRSAVPHRDTAARLSSILLFIGVVNIPIIHYSVYWWNTLHQGTSLSLTGTSRIAPAMLYPLLSMICAFVIYFIIVLLLRVRRDILHTEQKSEWVRKTVM